MQVRLSHALVCALPAMALAALILLPFLTTPFTIDDPIYLREAQHALVDPLHPQAFEMVWSTDLNLRASQILPGGIAMPYLLLPTALAGCAEWAGHLTQLLLLLVALLAVTLASLRMGMDSAQATLAGLLLAACPAVMGMAGTVMPDIPAMLFVILGIERVLAWRNSRKWHQVLLTTCWFSLAALTRTQTILILVPAFVLLLDGITADKIHASFQTFPARFVPILLTPIVYLAVSTVTADPDFQGENVLASMLHLNGGLRLLLQNGCAYLAHWLLVIPLTIPWLVLRFRRLSSILLMIALLFACVLFFLVGWIAFAAAATLVVLLDILWDALQRRDRDELALWLWLLLAVPVVIYIHLPSKYLLPSVPAAVMLVVKEARRTPARWIIHVTVLAGAVLGMLILLGTRDLANTQRRAVAELVAPRVKLGERVWIAGHWGFQWYAELAGASAVTLQPPQPLAGDTIVVSEIDLPRFPGTWTARKILQTVTYPSGAAGRVMDINAHVGFFSSAFGYLPWKWGSGEANHYEVWKVE